MVRADDKIREKVIVEYWFTKDSHH